MDEGSLKQIADQFALDTGAVSIVPYGTGHINRTFLVTMEDGTRCILQRISEVMTSDAQRLMENIFAVTEHLRKKEKDPRRVLTLISTKTGRPYLKAESGNWRVYRFVERSICLQQAQRPEDFYQSALAFGRFGELLRDFPAERLFETIPDFHNTPKRYRHFFAAVSEDRAGRRAKAEREISFLLEREEEAGLLQRLRDSGELPVRVTHNDTKLDNILFDRDTREALCIIDLDTVMPGLSLYDFGDSIRFGASTAPEDEKDLDRVTLDLDRYRIFREGFLKASPSLTRREIALLPMGAKVITLEQAVRFLTDYLEGDVYYRIHTPEQNLDRARTQIKLVEEMEHHWQEMNQE